MPRTRRPRKRAACRSHSGYERCLRCGTRISTDSPSGPMAMSSATKSESPSAPCAPPGWRRAGGQGSQTCTFTISDGVRLTPPRGRCRAPRCARLAGARQHHDDESVSEVDAGAVAEGEGVVREEDGEGPGFRRRGTRGLAAKTGRSRYGPKEVDKRNTESASQTRQHRDTHVAFSALDTTNVVSVNTGSGGQLLLGDLPVKPQGTKPPPQTPRKLACHAGNRGGSVRNCLHTIVFI